MKVNESVFNESLLAVALFLVLVYCDVGNVALTESSNENST